MSGHKPASKPRSENRQRTNLVAVRFTDSERAVLAEAAACTGKGVSTLLRETFLQHADFIIQMAAAKAAEPGRRARTEESERYPSWCVAHRRRLTWMPAPGWWIHADNRTCSSMWNARAPKGVR
jgi:hypothetical protein